jgi:hypothetical protein
MRGLKRWQGGGGGLLLAVPDNVFSFSLIIKTKCSTVVVTKCINQRQVIYREGVWKTVWWFAIRYGWFIYEVNSLLI